jgi:hypothetical protein
MNVKKSYEISILLLVCLGASEMLLFSAVLIYKYGLTSLFSTRVGRTIVFMLLIFTGAIFYYAYLKITGKEVIEPIDERLKDPRERALDINLPYHQAFDRCRGSVYFLPGGEIKSADENTGIIEGWAFSPSPSWVGTPIITIAIQKVDAGKTHINIHCITPFPSPRLVPRLIDSYFSQNERCVKRIHDYIQEPTNQGDGTFPRDEEDNPPDT